MTRSWTAGGAAAVVAAALLACGGSGGGGTSPVPAPTTPNPPAAETGTACAPATCGALGATCGSVPDGCGSTLECGGCASGTCGGGGVANVCGSPPVTGGETRWVHYVTGGGDEGVWRVRADAAGDLALILVRGPPDRQSVVVRKLSASRALRWERIVASPDGYAEPWAAAVSPAGSVLLSYRFRCHRSECLSLPDPGGGEMWSGVVKWAAGGDFEWQKLSDFYPGAGYYSPAVAVDPAGNVAVTLQPNDDLTTALFVYDHAGTTRWATGAAGVPDQLAFAPDGSLYAASGSRLRKLDAAGRLLWTAETSAPAIALAVSERGTPVVLSVHELAVHEAVDGALRFRRSLPMDARDLAVQPGTSDVIRVAVVGQASSGCNDLAVHTYDLSGAFRWSRSFPAHGSCGGAPQANAVAVLESGEVVVGGTMSVAADFGADAHAVEDLSDGFLVGLAP